MHVDFVAPGHLFVALRRRQWSALPLQGQSISLVLGMDVEAAGLGDLLAKFEFAGPESSASQERKFALTIRHQILRK